MRIVSLSVLSWLVIGAGACGGSVDETPSRYVLHVDRTAGDTVSTGATEPIPDSSYNPIVAHDRYEIVVSGFDATITPIVSVPWGGELHGVRVDATGDEMRFALDQRPFAGGTLVIRGEQGELTLYGSGVPIVSSERGTISRR
jgi:hypothetical protein